MPDDPKRPIVPAIGIRLFGRTFALRGNAAMLLVVGVPLVWIGYAIWKSITEPGYLRSFLTPVWASGAIWIFFLLYWNAAAKNAASTASAESPQSRAIHQLAMITSLVLLFWRVPGLRGRWYVERDWAVAAGLALQLMSVALAMWARRHLGRYWSGAITAKVGHELIRTGPYRRVRHPIYTAMLGMYLGTALVSGEWHALVAFELIFIAYARKIRLEEKNLRAMFGAEYDEYQKHSGALIPWPF